MRLAAAFLLFCACAPSRAELRRAEVRAWQQAHGQLVPSNAVDVLDLWKWGARLDTLVASTEGCELSADRAELRCCAKLDGLTGTVKFGFREGRLYRLDLRFPNSAEAERKVTSALDRTVGERPYRGPPLGGGGSSWVGVALLFPLLVIDAVASGRQGSSRGFIRAEWHTPSTDAVISVPGDERTLVLQAQARK